ncbi:YuzB family protein [Paenibacillus sp. CAU 1782]
MATNDIRVCDKCKHMAMKSTVAKIQKLAPDSEIRVGCKSYCGPCARYAFVFINGRYIKGATEDEAIEKAMTYLKK